MKTPKGDGRKDRLAAALKENLKRRKAKGRAKAGVAGLNAKDLGVAPQGEVGSSQDGGPKRAPKAS